MNILWLCPFFPYPLNTGIRIREYNLIRELSKWHRITLCSLIQSDDEVQNVPYLEPLCESVHAVRPGNQQSGAIDGRRSGWMAIKGILQKRPENFYGLPSSNVKKKIEEILNSRQFDVLIVDTLFMSNYVWDLLSGMKSHTVLVEHNVETLIQKQQWQLAQGLASKLRKWLYFSTFAGFEQTACRRFQTLIVVSTKDAVELRKISPRSDPEDVVVLPNGVDTRRLAPGKPDPEPCTLVFNGALSYQANFDAVQFFLKEIFPLILQNEPGARLTITGSTAGIDLARLNLNENVILTGYLDDVAPTIQSSMACVVPLTWGGGTRLKILEAMALGTPVVSTRKGVEGLDLEWGADVLVADEPRAFADQVLEIFHNPGLRARVAQSARRAVESRYDWRLIGEQFHQMLVKKMEPTHD